MAAALLAVAACGSSTSSEPSGPHVTILSPADRSTVGGNVVELKVRATGVEVVKADGDTGGRTGHYHVFIDRTPTDVGRTIPKEAGIVHSAESTIAIPGLSAGYHSFTVALGDGAHRRLDIPAASISVLVSGPSVRATAPRKVTAGEPVNVALSVEGIEIIKPNNDTSGATGHFHLFVDRPPVRAGQVIPKEPGIIHSAESTVPVPDLTPGDHTIWVVVGDGTHRALSPLVADRITITVTEAAPPS